MLDPVLDPCIDYPILQGCSTILFKETELKEVDDEYKRWRNK